MLFIEWIQIVLVIAATAVLVPAAMLALECLAALGGSASGKRAGACPAPRFDVLVPAHDEAAILAETLAALAPQLGVESRLWLVADNCSDATAQIARRFTGHVLERTDVSRRAKGFALDFGVRAIAAAGPPEVLIVIDADSGVASGSLTELAQCAADSDRPVQAAYIILPPPQATAGDLLSWFAVLVKNYVRPLGMS